MPTFDKLKGTTAAEFYIGGKTAVKNLAVPSLSADKSIIRWYGTSGSLADTSSASIDDAGSLNIVSGQTYNIDGNPHTHSYAATSHSATHSKAGTDELDGDTLDIDLSPSYYTPETVTAIATDTAHLTAHLKGIDTKLGTTISSTGWYAGGTFTRASDSTFTVTDNAANQANFCKGRPIRYRATAGTWRYGYITNYSSGTVTLAGAPLTTSDDDEIQYGDFTKIVIYEIGTIPGKFAATASDTILATAKIWLEWRQPPAFLVQFRLKVGTDDSGANQPRINVSVAGSKVSTSNSNTGVAISESWTGTAVDISTSNYDIAFGEAIEVTTDANGSNDDAINLYLQIIWVVV